MGYLSAFLVEFGPIIQPGRALVEVIRSCSAWADPEAGQVYLSRPVGASVLNFKSGIPDEVLGKHQGRD